MAKQINDVEKKATDRQTRQLASSAHFRLACTDNCTNKCWPGGEEEWAACLRPEMPRPLSWSAEARTMPTSALPESTSAITARCSVPARGAPRLQQMR